VGANRARPNVDRSPTNLNGAKPAPKPTGIHYYNESKIEEKKKNRRGKKKKKR